MSDRTRVVRVLDGGLARPQAGLSTITFGSSSQAPATTDRAIHARVHRVLRSAVLEQPRHGLLVLAVDRTAREVGRMWLAATSEPRAGTLGRHETVDLALGQDPGLSLRHLVFLVRTVAYTVRFTAIDLATPAGVCSVRAQVSMVETSRPVLLKGSGLCFFCVPTGPGATLAADPDQAFAQLASEAAPRAKTSGAGGPGGQLTVRQAPRARVFEVSGQLLREGVLIGREPRCDLILPDPYASRVHAVVVSIDGAPYLVDTGSGNGTRHLSGERAECWPLHDGDAFLLGNSIVEWRRH